MTKKLILLIALFLIAVPVASTVAGADEPAAPPAAEGTDTASAIFAHDVDNYVVEATRTDAGVLVTVVPKGIYKVNVQYPWKYKVAGETKYKKDAFELTEQKAVLTMADAEDGELRFSICSPETCLIEKVPVTLSADSPAK